MNSPRKNDIPILLRAYAREVTDRVPVWYMRQAGRYLPEYNEIRSDLSFMELVQNVDQATAVSLQPLRRFGLDGVIFFSDILTPLHAAGIDLHFEEKRGPVITTIVEKASDLDRLRDFLPDRDCPYVGEIQKRIRQTLGTGSERAALLGFAGAPFTLASYLWEGGTSRRFERTKQILFGEPDFAHAVLERLVEITVAYLDFQLRSGAEAVQIFDSWAGILRPEHYEEFAGRYTGQIIEQLRRRHPNPVILFVGNSAHLLGEMVAQSPQVISLDWRVTPTEAARMIPTQIAIQGNLDPLVLYGAPERVTRETLRILEAWGKRPGYVFNLGHGIHPSTPIENVTAMLEAVRAFRPS
ncbi:MAG: uroporphyrinogen decarboxylase [Spirochaetales bacterium]|nr:uroporphyrinogen decarboxylase [Leptospiraceae bacterium]MCP5483711.1 uroporphyrinogen decarboxylase [Spirochaetales bacterium]MCP5484806.1 uroporphyrinogen decarboxylase [Spirochaetales bacterium]